MEWFGAGGWIERWGREFNYGDLFVETDFLEGNPMCLGRKRRVDV